MGSEALAFGEYTGNIASGVREVNGRVRLPLTFSRAMVSSTTGCEHPVR